MPTGFYGFFGAVRHFLLFKNFVYIRLSWLIDGHTASASKNDFVVVMPWILVVVEWDGGLPTQSLGLMTIACGVGRQ